MNTFWNIYPLYIDRPPVKTDLNGDLCRDRGGSHRTFFWAGYDGLKSGLYPPSRNNGLGVSAYRAGIDYRKSVDSGKTPALPNK